MTTLSNTCCSSYLQNSLHQQQTPSTQPWASSLTISSSGRPIKANNDLARTFDTSLCFPGMSFIHQQLQAFLALAQLIVMYKTYLYTANFLHVLSCTYLTTASSVLCRKPGRCAAPFILPAFPHFCNFQTLPVPTIPTHCRSSVSLISRSSFHGIATLIFPSLLTP